MTVSELIEELKTMPQDMEAVVRGYEAGYDPILKVHVVEAIDDGGAASYEGRYAENDGWREGQSVGLVYIEEQ